MSQIYKWRWIRCQRHTTDVCSPWLSSQSRCKLSRPWFTTRCCWEDIFRLLSLSTKTDDDWSPINFLVVIYWFTSARLVDIFCTKSDGSHIYIAVTSYERHGVLTHRHHECLLNSLFRLTSSKLHLADPVCEIIHQWSVDFPHKILIRRKPCSCHDVFINLSPSSAAYMRRRSGSSLVQIMACRLFGSKPLSKPVLGYC